MSGKQIRRGGRCIETTLDFMGLLGSDSPAGCDIEVRYVRTNADEEAWAPRLLPQLTAAERERAVRYVRAADTLAFAAGRALVRSALSRYAAPPPGGWQFDSNAYGKPGLRPAPGTPPLRFSISHCAGIVAAGFAVGRDVGLDVENADRGGADIGVARAYFAEEEASYLDSLPEERKREAFFAFWTLKESYIKARGMGLSIPLADFSFALDPIRIAFSPRIADRAEHWSFWQRRLTPSHVMAVAAARKPDETPSLRVREIPLESLL